MNADAAPPPDAGEVRKRREIVEAAELAGRSGKRVLVAFGASWCRDTAALERLFEHPLVAPLLAAGFEVVRLDVVNRERYRDLATTWGIDFAAGLPAIAVIEAGGRLVGATARGELATARTLSAVALAALLHPWLPENLRG